MPVAALPSIHRHGGYLPAEPLAAIVRRDAEAAYNTRARDDRGVGLHHPGSEILSQLTGISERVLRDITQGRFETVTLDTADRYLCNTGRQLRDVYPWLYEPEQIAADLAAAEQNETGIEVRHRTSCATQSLDGCTCKPGFQACIYRAGERLKRTFNRREDARAWRQEWMVRA